MQLAIGARPSADDRPLNILLLYADDWQHDTLGVAGNPVVLTPNLDRLASQGMRFTQNCVTTSICGVSRATLFTGQWMSRHECRGFSAFKTPWEKTYPGLLRNHGYYVGHVGKWHNGTFPAEEFDFGRSYYGKHWYKLQTDPSPAQRDGRIVQTPARVHRKREKRRPPSLALAV